MSKTIYIGGRLESKEKGNVVTGANAILDDTKGKKQNVINKETDDELLRLEQSKQDNLTFDNTPTEDSTNPVTSGGVYTAEKALSDAIEAILLLIPSAATALNKLVDTNTMNSSISTATATFRGTYNAVSDLGLTYQATHAQIEAALDALGLTADNNDFAFVQIPVSDQSQDIAKTERFKFNGTNWLYEYDLNTSGFTAVQWAAINSGITVALVTKLTDLPTAAALQLALNAKQDTLNFDTEPTASSTNPVTSGGIYLAIQAVATALSNYSNTTDNRLNTLEGLVPTEASSSNKLTDKAYVDGLIQAITELIPAEATTTNQLADKAYVLASILAATPAFKGQFVTLAELQAVASPKADDLGIVRTKDSDGMDVFTVYQYLNNAWNVFYSLSYHPQTKPATTGTTGDYPYNGMGRVELAMNMVNDFNTLTQDMFYKGAVGSRVPNTNTIFVIRYDYVLAENITIPDGCVLEFDGGSISAGSGENMDTITGNKTTISNESNSKIFGTDVIFTGSWATKECTPEWFGATGTGDDTNAVKAAINNYVIYYDPVQYPNDKYQANVRFKHSITYNISESLIIPSNFRKQRYYCEGTAIINFTHTGDGFVLNQAENNWDWVIFENLIIRGVDTSKMYSALSEKTSDGAAINIIRAYNCNFYNVVFQGFKYGIKVTKGIKNIFRDCTFRNNLYGVYIYGNIAANYFIFNDCMIRENYICGVYSRGAAQFNIFDECDFESNCPYLESDIATTNSYGVWVVDSNLYVTNAYFENNPSSHIYIQSYGQGCIFENINFNINNYKTNPGKSVILGTNVRNIRFKKCFDLTGHENISIAPNGGDKTLDLSGAVFEDCTGLNYEPQNSASYNPTFIQMYRFQNHGYLYNRINVFGVEAGRITLTDNGKDPYLDKNNKALYARGFGSLIIDDLTEDAEITTIVGMKRGEFLDIHAVGVPAHSLKISSLAGSSRNYGIILKNNTYVTLAHRGDDILFFCSPAGDVTEITNNIPV